MKILIADDDRVLTHLMASRLRARGWEVEVAHDAMQAVMFALKVPPDVIALDLGMPAGTGFEVLKKLKLSVKTSEVPVVVVSASIAPDAEAKAAELGAVAFLHKPVDPDAMHAALLQVLRVPAA